MPEGIRGEMRLHGNLHQTRTSTTVGSIITEFCFLFTIVHGPKGFGKTALLQNAPKFIAEPFLPFEVNAIFGICSHVREWRRGCCSEKARERIVAIFISMADHNFRYRSKQTNLKLHKTVRATSEVEARKLSSRKLRKFSRSSLSRNP
jgi:hypothetical protein